MAPIWETPWRERRRVRVLKAVLFDALAVAVLLVGSAMAFSAVLEGGAGVVKAFIPALVVGVMAAVAVREWGRR